MRSGGHIRILVGTTAAARSVLGVQGRFSGGVWLVRQSADFAEEPLEGPDLVAERPPPLGRDLYPGAWAAIARCLGLGNKAGLFQRLRCRPRLPSVTPSVVFRCLTSALARPLNEARMPS